MNNLISDAPKLIPHNVEAEQSILGAILLDARALDQALEILTAADFYYTKHRRIFAVMQALHERRESIDLVTLSDALQIRQELEDVGGSSYLAECVQVTPTAAAVRSHAKIVKETAKLREWISLCHRLLTQAYERQESIEVILEAAEQNVFRLLQGASQGGFERIRESLKATLDHLMTLSERESHLTGISTGFEDLDEKLAGLQNGDLVIVAGRPSMGKTSLALSLALTAAAPPENRVVGFFSLEMSRAQLLVRLLSMGAKIDSHVMRTGQLAKGDWWKVAETVQQIEHHPIFIDDSGELSIAQLRSRARRLKAEHGLGLLIIDYLQLLSGRPSADNRQQEISEISRALKALAKELNVPVVALSQLARRVEERKPPIPILADLRESGAIEQDADVVCFIYREEVYDQHSEKAGQADLIIAKQRNGPIGTVTLAFLKHYSRFENLYRPPTLYEQRALESPADR